MSYQGTADVNFHHKEVTFLDFQWVDKAMVVHVEMRQYEEQIHEGHKPALILSRVSPDKEEEIMVVPGRVHGHVLVSLDHKQSLVARISPHNPNSAGTVKWEFIA